MFFFFKLIARLFKFVLMLTGILSFTRCGSGYKKDGDKVLFDGKEVSPSLQVLNTAFAKDDSNAYYKRYAITGAHISSFTALDENYAKDKDHVYFCDEYREGQNYYLTKKATIKKVSGAAPAAFIVIGDGYGKDNTSGFFEGIPFAVKDPATLTLINRQFVYDNIQAYFEQKPVKGSDGKSFRIVNNAYAADTNNIYFYGYTENTKGAITIMPCHKASFSPLQYPFSKDAASVFYENRKIAEAVSASFITLQHGFSKDQQAVFFETKKIAGADAASFVMLPEGDSTTEEYYYAKDKTGIFWKDKRIGPANPASFRFLGHDYSADDQHVFYKAGIVAGGDPASFKQDSYTLGDADAQDKNNQYKNGIRIKN